MLCYWHIQLVIGLILTGFFPAVSLHAEEIIAFSGVVTAEGKPVVEATVWLIQGSSERPGMDSGNAILAQVKTDHRGQFRLPYCKDKSLAGILVRAVDGRMSEINKFAVVADPLHLTCELPAGKEYRGRLIDQTGKPWAGAIVQPVRVLGGARRRTDLGKAVFTSIEQHVEVPPPLQQQFQVTTGDDGNFVLPGIPHPGLLHLKVTLRTGYEVRTRFDVERKKEIVIAQPGKLVVKFTGIDDPTALRDSLWGALSSNDDSASEFALSCYCQETNRGTVELSIDGLHPGHGWIQADYQSNVPFVYSSVHSPQFSIKSGETTKLSIPLVPAIKVTGRVVDQNTKQGINGVTVGVSSTDPYSAHMVMPLPTVTQANGTFTRYVRPGLVNCTMYYAPPKTRFAGNEFLRNDRRRPVEVTQGEIVWPDIELSRSVSLRGQVLNIQGKPVAGAWILTTQNYYHSLANTPMTDHDGRFELNNLRPEVLEIYVRSNQGVSPELVKVNLDKPLVEVVLQVDPKAAVYLEGQMIDTLGKPLPRLSLELDVPLRDVPESYASRGLRFWLQPTDTQGRFRAGPFWPGQKYQLSSWIVEQQARFRSQLLLSVPGENLQFGKMVYTGYKP